ncbi:MAG: 23S rRNA (guanosine(2251)-2'-O)-methyltransferase RlmB [Chloroflexota bacterium]
MAATELLVGRNAVREALRAGRRRVHRLLVAEGVREGGPIGELFALCEQRRVPVARTAREELDRLGGPLHHQGVAAEVSPYPYVTLEVLWAAAGQRGEPPLLLVLDSLQDPQNVGSLLRTAEAVGAHGLILPDRRAAQVTPAVSRASAGAAEHLRVAQVVNLARALAELKERGIWAVGVEDRPEAQDYRRADWGAPLALVLGGEGEGLRPLVVRQCDWLVRIPMRGQINSLNVAVAGALVLYQAWQARQATAAGQPD